MHRHTFNYKTMKSLESIIDENIGAIINRIAKEQKQQNYYLTQMSKELDRVKVVLPAIESFANKQGLEIVSFHSIKTGGDNSKWEKGDEIRINFTLAPIGKKFRFISFQGYTSRGHGHNAKQLLQKEWKLEEGFKLAINDRVGVAVNPYSLEKKEGDSQSRVSVDIWFKA